VTALHPDVSDDNDGATSSEQKMRRTFEARRGVPFSDEEWEEAKRNLVGLFLMMGTRDVSSADDDSSH
jgi:hypothetical protein